MESDDPHPYQVNVGRVSISMCQSGLFVIYFAILKSSSFAEPVCVTQIMRNTQTVCSLR